MTVLTTWLRKRRRDSFHKAFQPAHRAQRVASWQRHNPVYSIVALSASSLITGAAIVFIVMRLI